MTQHTERFTNRVENYIRSRPGYPAGVLDTLQKDCGLLPSWAVADVGSGTGLLTELFLKNGNSVHGVEPNAEMREASAKLLGDFPKFHAVDGSAEDSRLPAASVRLITAAQAFHWFDQLKARREFERILQPGGYVAIIFNTRKVEGSPLGEDYEVVVRKYGTNYTELRHENLTDQELAGFFGPKGCAKKTFPYNQLFDLDGFRGRIASMSWVPLAGDPKYDLMMEELEPVFDRHQRGGKVVFEYITELHYGRLS